MVLFILFPAVFVFLNDIQDDIQKGNSKRFRKIFFECKNGGVGGS